MNARIEGGCPAEVVDEAMRDIIDRHRTIRADEKLALLSFIEHPDNIALCGEAVLALSAIVLRMAGEGD